MQPSHLGIGKPKYVWVLYSFNGTQAHLLKSSTFCFAGGKNGWLCTSVKIAKYSKEYRMWNKNSRFCVHKCLSLCMYTATLTVKESFIYVYTRSLRNILGSINPCAIYHVTLDISRSLFFSLDPVQIGACPTLIRLYTLWTCRTGNCASLESCKCERSLSQDLST